MCKTCVHKARSAVRIEGTLSSFFENKTGLKEGDYQQYYANFFIKMVRSVIKIGKEQLNI